ncbi:uncharacterized protein LOC112090903 [Morus notabilis]|uniref:uncharacterized protein LOC112090903 n=1 Tax=Morus notabilis TaxID=981085 RepID=UPI000CED1B8F|nr:uncharacterized protein LOC112090903 [Morus notabilis]
MAWLIHSMEDHIADTYILFPTAKSIWDAVSLAYSDLQNSSQMFELRTRARNLRQGENDVTQYYTELTKLWQELDLFITRPWKSTDDAVADRTYDFLAGLNPELDDVRSRLIALKPLPNIGEIFAEIRHEEHRRRVMLGNFSKTVQTTPSTDSYGLVTCGLDSRTDARGLKKWCDHCKKPYHTRETCWKLHGKPAVWTPNRAKGRDGKGMQVSSDVVADNQLGTTFSKEQLDQL